MVVDLPGPGVMLDVLEEHFEELDFLWEQRERVLFAPDWTVPRLAELEERAEAHLDGLRIGGAHALAIARRSLGGDEPSAATAAAFTLLATGTEACADEVMAALASDNPAARRGIRLALRHVEVAPVADALYGVAVGRDPMLRAIAADVLAFHRLRPPPELEPLLRAEDPAVCCLAYGAVGRFGGPLAERDVEDALRSETPAVRRAALEAAARCGLPVLPALCRQATRGARAVPEAVEFLGVIGGKEDVSALKSALAEPELARAALAGLGALGSAVGIPVLVDAVATPALARAAGAAFTRITGIDELGAVPPPAAPEGDDPADDEPLPDPARVRAAWERCRGRLAGDGCWQAGENTSALELRQALRVLSLESRRDVYLALRARDPRATPDVELERRMAADPVVRAASPRGR